VERVKGSGSGKGKGSGSGKGKGPGSEKSKGLGIEKGKGSGSEKSKGLGSGLSYEQRREAALNNILKTPVPTSQKTPRFHYKDVESYEIHKYAVWGSKTVL
jgi:hypothetical protein